jgi:hypothetical protein
VPAGTYVIFPFIKASQSVLTPAGTFGNFDSVTVFLGSSVFFGLGVVVGLGVILLPALTPGAMLAGADGAGVTII